MSKIQRLHTIPAKYELTGMIDLLGIQPQGKQKQTHIAHSLNTVLHFSSFRDKFEQANIMFLHQIIYDPRTKTRKPLNPFSKETEALAKVRGKEG